MAVGLRPRERTSKTERIAKPSTTARARMSRPVGRSRRLARNGQPGALELRRGLGHRRNGQPVALELVPRLGPSRVRGRRFWPSYAAVRVDKRHVRNETIATFWKSLDISRILSRVPQSAPELRDCNVDRLVEITKTFVGPDSAAEFLPGDDFPRTFQQDLQQFQRLLLDSDSHTRFAHLARLERNLIGSESHDQGMPQGFHIRASHGSLALYPGKGIVSIGMRSLHPHPRTAGSHPWGKDMCRANLISDHVLGRQ